MTKLHVVTAMVDPGRTHDLWRTWRDNSGAGVWSGHVCLNGARTSGLDDSAITYLMGDRGSCAAGPDIKGTVPAFAAALETFTCAGDDVLALFHDDLAIHKRDWDLEILEFFRTHPGAGMVGFGGAYGVGVATMYNCRSCEGGPFPGSDLVGNPVNCRVCAMNVAVFDPMTLARHHFMSGMRDAEAHGERVATPRPVAVLDGFSLVGRAWLVRRALQRLMELRVVHHAYDVAFGCETRRAGLQTWLLPISCHHAGGQTAVGSAAYQEWAKAKHGGDGEVWKHAHRMVWEEYRDVLPFDVRQG